MPSDEEKRGEEGSSRNEYTVDEAMEELNLCRKSIYNYIERGTLSASKVNGKWMIRGESIKRLPRKKSRKPWEQEGSTDRVSVDQTHYEELLKQAGKLRALEEVWEYKGSNEELERRVWSLEQELGRYRKEGFWSRHFGARRREGNPTNDG